MKSIIYLLTILFLSLLLACSEEPPTGVDIENLNKKPIKDPPTPTPTEPLVLLDNANQISGFAAEEIGRREYIGVIKIWTYEGGTYSESWRKEIEGGVKTAIGDIDNDGHDELVVTRRWTTGKRRNRVNHEEILVFESGDTVASWTRDMISDGTSGVRYMTLGDANNDETLEIAFASGRGVSVYDYNETAGISLLWASEDLYADQPWSIEVANADNDEDNELIYAGLGGQRFGVYNYLGGNNWGDKVYSPAVFCGLDRAFVADVDGDEVNEVIGGGCDSKLYVWKQVNGEYILVFESEDLGGFTQGIAAGDFDNDGLNEIAVGTANFVNGKVFVFKYDTTTLTYTSIFEETISGRVNSMFAGDSDNDGIDEFIVASGEGLLVYDYIGGYSQTYSDPDGGGGIYVK